MLVIGESLHRQRYKYLWDNLFDRHPRGSYIRGKWEGMGSSKTDIPSDTLVLELLREKPVVLLLDEFQTWYDGLTNTKQYPWKNWAFNFIQILSEIAKEHPDLLVLVVSVRNGSSDAYHQIHRVNPVAIDFKAGGYLAWSAVRGLAMLLTEGPLRRLTPAERDAIGQRLLDMVEKGL
jgi:hypothetical protein